jgi:hypothetical protein
VVVEDKAASRSLAHADAVVEDKRRPAVLRAATARLKASRETTALLAALSARWSNERRCLTIASPTRGDRAIDGVG